MTLEQIEDLIAYEKDGKEINNWKFGIELEYGGVNNSIRFDANDDIIETIKNDCSVSGDGTEYNLKPISFNDLKADKKIIRALESFCYRVANKNCTLSKTAGMHIHFSWDKEFNTPEGKVFGEILQEFGRWLHYSYGTRKIKDAMVQKDIYIKTFKVPTDAIEWVEKEEDKWEVNMMKKLYDAFQFLYSISERDGTEAYGLGTDYTRGYTFRHNTLELRCWRTSYDFREIIARVFVARFFLQYILRIGLCEKNGLKEEINSIESIWDYLNKKENEKLKSMYEYLAYNSKNKHKVGLEPHMLMAKLKTYDSSYANEIKKRSDIYDKALKDKTSAKKAKNVFETIISFDEEKGEENESRI